MDDALKGRVFMAKRQALQVAAAILCAWSMLGAAENLKLNPHLDYSSDSQDGPLITGVQMDEGLSPDMPNYVIFFGEG
jgi:hypothetical protein